MQVDPLAEKYYGISPYAYCAGDPVRYVDRDGEDWRDVVNGFSSAVRTNFSPVNPSDPISPDISNATHYAVGRYLGDAATIVLGAQMVVDGAAMIAGGAGATAGGAVAAPATAGASVAVSAVGAGAVAAGAAMSATGAAMFMKGVKGAAKDVSSFNGGNDTDSRTSNEAFRKAKDQNGIPRSQQPEKTVKPNTPEGDSFNLNKENTVLYIFRNNKNKIIHIRKDKPVKYYDGGSQGPHYNAGDGSGSNLKQHHYFRHD